MDAFINLCLLPIIFLLEVVDLALLNAVNHIVVLNSVPLGMVLTDAFIDLCLLLEVAQAIGNDFSLQNLIRSLQIFDIRRIFSYLLLQSVQTFLILFQFLDGITLIDHRSLKVANLSFLFFALFLQSGNSRILYLIIRFQRIQTAILLRITFLQRCNVRRLLFVRVLKITDCSLLLINFVFQSRYALLSLLQAFNCFILFCIVAL